MAPASVLFAPTITKLPAAAAGAVVVSGSHGGVYPGYLAAKAGVRAAVFSDAGIGRDEAGIGSLAYLDALGIAAACLSHASCRIGDTDDMAARGEVSRANRIAAALGVLAGLPCPIAAEMLRDAPRSPQAVEPPPVREGRDRVEAVGGRTVHLLDSAALVRPDDAGGIVVTGSHGGLVGGDPAMALRTDAFAAVFNDAGGGRDGAGVTRLPALARRGIAAITVSAASARIGDARSSFADGIVSALNGPARALGAREGVPARDLILRWATA